MPPVGFEPTIPVLEIKRLLWSAPILHVLATRYVLHRCRNEHNEHIFPLVVRSFSIIECVFHGVRRQERYCHVSGAPWLIIRGSGLDDWIYWHFFTITINCNSSQSTTAQHSLHSSLDYECLLFCCDEWWMKNHLRLNCNELFSERRLTNALSFITQGEPQRDHYLQQCVWYCVDSLPRDRA
jgi:hypothetical protein